MEFKNVIAIMEDYGEVSDEIFEDLGIVNESDNKCRDKFCVNRRGSLFLTHPDILKKEIDRKRARDALIQVRGNKRQRRLSIQARNHQMNEDCLNEIIEEVE